MNTSKNRILIVIIVLVLLTVACVGGGGGGNGGGGNPVTNNMILSGPDATAAYGAKQLDIQLTAVARPGKP